MKFRIIEIRRRKDGARVVTLGVEDPQYHGQHEVLVLPGDDFETKVKEEMQAFYNSLSVQEWEASPIKVGDTFEVDDEGIREVEAPRDEELEDTPWLKVAPRYEEIPAPPPPRYRYELYSDEFTHPKARAPIRINQQTLVFDEELTPDEIRDLEARTGKKVRKVA